MDINEYWKKQLSKHTKSDLVDKILFAYAKIKKLEAKLAGANNLNENRSETLSQPSTIEHERKV